MEEKSNEAKNERITAEQALMVLENERNIRVKQCTLEIENCLKKFGCKIDAGVTLRKDNVSVFVNIVSI